MKATDMRLIKEAVRYLWSNSGPICLKDLHQSCQQGSKHKSIRQFASILRLKGEHLIYKIEDEELHLIGWREGPVKIYALSSQIDPSNIYANVKLAKKIKITESNELKVIEVKV